MTEQKRVLVIGGGISGITAAIETAEAGHDVVLVEKNPYLGGRVAQLNKYFPKLCPPNCGLELNFRRIRENSDVEILPMTTVEKITGGEGDYEVTVKVKPRYVNDKCTACDACAQACPAERPNDFNFGMDKTKAAYLPFSQAFPTQYVIDSEHCKGDCGKACRDACKYDAIDLDMKEETKTFKVSSVVVATGWQPYDAARMDNLGFGKVKNVVTNMMMERMASPNGPTKGRIVRPSDQKEVKKIAFVQCAGSRDENHLPFCSYICCMASLKQATYLRDVDPESAATIFYIDMRTPGRYETFFNRVKADENVSLVKGKVADIQESKGGNVLVTAEDAISGKKMTEEFEMVVLATGMQPSAAGQKVPGLDYTEEGFLVPSRMKKGITAVGSTKNPVDVQRSVQDATGAAVKSIQLLRR